MDGGTGGLDDALAPGSSRTQRRKGESGLGFESDMAMENSDE
jgi:hypothetical protein